MVTMQSVPMSAVTNQRLSALTAEQVIGLLWEVCVWVGGCVCVCVHGRNSQLELCSPAHPSFFSLHVPAVGTVCLWYSRRALQCGCRNRRSSGKRRGIGGTWAVLSVSRSKCQRNIPFCFLLTHCTQGVRNWIQMTMSVTVY